MQELKPEKEPSYSIEDPKEGDEIAVGPVHQQAWLETYPNPEFGITEELVKNKMAFTTSEKSNLFRKNAIAEAVSNPDKFLYKVVKNSDNEIVGFLHCSKNDEYNELGAIYLLNEAKGLGVGAKLMELFLAWRNESKPCRLEVIAFNDRALSFYNRYGFEKTEKEIPSYVGGFPVVEMIRPVEVAEPKI